MVLETCSSFDGQMFAARRHPSCLEVERDADDLLNDLLRRVGSSRTQPIPSYPEKTRSIIRAMVWLAVAGVAALVMALFVAARRTDGAGGDPDLGTISGNWLNERRIHDRDSDPNR